MNYYVDGAVASSGNGISWAGAWKNFSNINWPIIKAGDVITISGGTYTTPLVIGASGVTITKATEAGHDASVVIDHQVIGVEDNGFDNVRVSGLTVNGTSDAGFSIKNVHSGVIIEGNSVFSGDPGGGNARGYDVRNSSGVIVRNNTFTTPSFTNAQTDGIWSSANNGVLFQNNRIDITNTSSAGHSDGIQSFQDVNITISGNYIGHPNGGVNNHGMWISNMVSDGTITVDNNVLYMPKGDEGAISAWNADAAFTGRADIHNNTIYGGFYGIQVAQAPLSEVKSNIVVASAGRVGVVVAGNLPGGNINGNVIFAPNATIGSINGSSKTWAQWQAIGYDTNGVNADPLLVNPAGGDFSLRAGSPAIGAGANQISQEPPPSPPIIEQNKLALILSETRAKNTDVRFIAKIDGTPVSGPLTVTALHGSGATQEFDFLGSWGVGKHDFSIEILNYKKGMNLYINDVELNGVSYLSDPISVHRHGEIHIAIGVS